MDSTFRYEFANDFDAFAEMASAASAAGDRLGLSPHTAYSIDLVLEELVTNIIKYGYDDPGKHLITVELAAADDGAVALTLTDDGHRFDPVEKAKRDAAAPNKMNSDELQVGGWGLSLVLRSSSAFTYERTNGKNVTRVTFAPDAPKK